MLPKFTGLLHAKTLPDSDPTRSDPNKHPAVSPVTQIDSLTMTPSAISSQLSQSIKNSIHNTLFYF